MPIFFVMPKLTSIELGGPVTGLSDALYKDPTHPPFLGLTLGHRKLLFNSCK